MKWSNCYCQGQTVLSSVAPSHFLPYSVPHPRVPRAWVSDSQEDVNSFECNGPVTQSLSESIVCHLIAL